MRVLNAAGIAAPVLWLLAWVGVGSLHAEYSHSRQYISELAARGSSTQHLMQVVGFFLPGVLVGAFGLYVGLSAHTKLAGTGAALLVVGAVARIVAGVFPLDACCVASAPSFSERMHNSAGTAYVIATAGAVLVWAAAARPHWFRWYSLATFIAALTLPLGLIRVGVDPGNVGLFQRVSFGALNLWLLVFALLVQVRGTISDHVPQHQDAGELRAAGHG